jgi:hypothetical protein
MRERLEGGGIKAWVSQGGHGNLPEGIIPPAPPLRSPGVTGPVSEDEVPHSSAWMGRITVVIPLNWRFRWMAKAVSLWRTLWKGLSCRKTICPV